MSLDIQVHQNDWWIDGIYNFYGKDKGNSKIFSLNISKIELSQIKNEMIATEEYFMGEIRSSVLDIFRC